MQSQVPSPERSRVVSAMPTTRRARPRVTQVRRVAVAPLLAPPPPARRVRDIVGVVGSLLFHGAVLVIILRAGIEPRAIEVATPIEVAVVETTPPPPPPPKEEQQAPEPPKPAAPKLRTLKLPPPPKDAPPPPPKLEAPPPPNETPPPDATPKAPVMIGLSMSSTTSAGSFAAPVGNTLYGAAPRTAAKPEDVKPYASANGRYVPPYKAAQLPVPINVPVLPYPPEARKLEIEGTVVLQVTVDATGKVVKVTVVRGLGHGLDEVAVDALRRAKFKPGTDGSGPIITEINYSYTFELND